MDPNYLLQEFGTAFFWVSAAIVFIECGLLFPILPGDSLLFACGLFIATGQMHPFPGSENEALGIIMAILILSLAAFAGNVTGYEIGRAVGPPLYNRNGRFLKKKYFDQTHEFFEKYGAKALILGRFVPIVRTFVTVVAGVGRMNRRHFFTWSGVGAFLWVGLMMLLGYFLGGISAVKDNIELAAIAIILVSVLPMVFEYLKHRKRAHEAAADVAETIVGEDPRA